MTKLLQRKKIIAILSIVLCLPLVILISHILWVIAPTPIDTIKMEYETLTPSADLNYEIVSSSNSEGVKIELFKIKDHDSNIYDATLLNPSHHTPKCLVVYVHGSGPNWSRGFFTRKFKPYINSTNCIFGSAEKIGVEEKKVNQRQFHKSDYREARVRDISRFINIIKSRNSEIKNLYLIGHSEGGNVVASLASSRKDVSSVVLMSSGGYGVVEEFKISLNQLLCADDFEICKSLVNRYVTNTFSKIASNPVINETFLGLSHKRWVSYFRNPIDDLSKFAGLILFVHGKRDTNSPAKSSIIAYEKFREEGKNTKIDLYENLDHSYINSDGDDYIKKVIHSIFDHLNIESS